MARLAILWLAAASDALKPAAVHLGECVVQRAVQTQLQYSAALRNEPQVSWLSQFLDHEHLDSTGRHIGAAGLAQSYTPALRQLTTGWVEYLDALGDAEDTVVEVELAQPPNRLSERQKKNPFLMAQAQKSMFYDEPISPRWILHRMLKTADALCSTWTTHLGVLEEDDLERVARDRMAVKGLPSKGMDDIEQLREGGETVYTQGDDQMPLAVFDRRLCDRVCTLRALDALSAELAGLEREADPVKAVASTDYLRIKAVTEARDDCDDERVLAKREARRRRLEGAWATGDDAARATAAIAAARAFVSEFQELWGPLLEQGGRLSDVEKRARRKPGQKPPRLVGHGADADEAMEIFWEYRERYARASVAGGELVLPAKMGLRVRELRAAAARAARDELAGEVIPRLRLTRDQYPEPEQALGAAMQALTNSYRLEDSGTTLGEAAARAGL